MFEIIDSETIVLTDENKQRVDFITDGNGDYYFMLYSNDEVRSGDYYSFLIDESNIAYKFFRRFVEQEVNYITSEEVIKINKTPYFIIDNNSVRIADQNRTIIDSEFLKICLFQDKIKLIFSAKYPSSIRINGIGRQDYNPFFIPVIDLFNSLQNTNTKKVIKGTEINRETFCHRRIVADFIDLESEIIVPENSKDNLGNVTLIEQRDYKPKLRKLIKQLK
ncbi:MAG: hypothetical protein PHW32_02540 [Bacilli bacterium]|nr:hypothetical protein [Bacilli bacterium]MDD4283073.1 hypothetical protein [Bacilli bacterium]MDD4718754.1 hypothetical protein [Bacilli bacterium]